MIACAHFAVMANPLSAEDDSPHGRGIFQRAQPIGDVSLFLQRGATLTSLLLHSSFTEKAQRESPCWNINIMEEKHLFGATWREERRIIDPQPWTLFACRIASDRRRCAATSPCSPLRKQNGETVSRLVCEQESACQGGVSREEQFKGCTLCQKSSTPESWPRAQFPQGRWKVWQRRSQKRENEKREAGWDSVVLLDD